MSNSPESPKTAAAAATPAPKPSDQFVLDEYSAAQKAVRTSRLVAIGLIAFVGAYMGYVASELSKHLEPKNAAEHATGIIAGQVETHAGGLARRIETEAPAMVARVPNMILEQLPVWRKEVEDKLAEALRNSLRERQVELAKAIDTSLAEHNSAVKALVANAADKNALNEVAKELEKDVSVLLSAPGEGNNSLQKSFDNALLGLSTVEKQLTKLAENKNLTSQEKRTRRSIAIIVRKIKASQKPSGV
ncbi:MAG TPA: hypothetical protein VK968_15130 [Roseimicrobium sp.]|nr:hypothetical protein [Roseimicrobium sp.]